MDLIKSFKGSIVVKVVVSRARGVDKASASVAFAVPLSVAACLNVWMFLR